MRREEEDRERQRRLDEENEIDAAFEAWLQDRNERRERVRREAEEAEEEGRFPGSPYYAETSREDGPLDSATMHSSIRRVWTLLENVWRRRVFWKMWRRRWAENHLPFPTTARSTLRTEAGDDVLRTSQTRAVALTGLGVDAPSDAGSLCAHRAKRRERSR